MIVTLTLVADGSSDRALEPIIRLVMDSHCPHPYRVQTAEHAGAGHRLRDRLPAALTNYPCDVLVVHRDAEATEPMARLEEIERALEECGIRMPTVPLIPVRMTEAWLLVDQVAIRRAVGNPNGRSSLELPPPRDIERVAAKEVLFRALELASELGVRRLRRFDPHPYRHRIADNFSSSDPLRTLTSFCAFEAAVRIAMQELV